MSAAAFCAMSEPAWAATKRYPYDDDDPHYYE